MYLVEILERCSNIEQRVARVYRSLAERFRSSSDTARVWRELALEEETHADILRREMRAFESRDDSGAFLPEFAPRLERVHLLLVDIEQRLPHVQHLDDAITLAIALEQAELEDLYDDLVTQGYPEFKLICERLEAPLARSPATRTRRS